MNFSDDLFNSHIIKLRQPRTLSNKNAVSNAHYRYTIGKMVYAIRKNWRLQSNVIMG